MSEIGSATVAVFPTFQNFRTAVVSEVDSSAAEASRSFGERFRGGLGTAVRGAGVAIGATLAAGAAGAGALIATSLSRGLDRALNLQDARASLQGLGHDAETVGRVMDNALASVRGTAFNLDEAAGVAASAVAAGVRPGEELQRTLGLVADAASIAGTDMNSMGAIFNKVATGNRVSADIINQMHSRQIPALQLIAEEMGVTADAASDMVSRGEVDFATFQRAMESGLGGAALASGNTARGAWGLVGAALSRLGAQFVSGGVEGAPGLFRSIAGAVDRAAAALAPLAERLNARVGPAMAQLAGWIDRIDFGQLATQIGALFSGADFSSAGSAVSSISDAFAQVSPFLSQVWSGLQSIGGVLGGVFAAGLRAAEPLLGLVADGLNWVADNSDMLPGIILGVVGAMVAFRASQIAANFAMLAAIPAAYGNVAAQFALAAAQRATGTSTAVNTGLQIAQRGAFLGSTVTVIANTAAMVAARVAAAAGAVATGVAAAAQWGLNAAMSANPIALVVIAIAALVAGLIWFFTQTELGQEIWANFTRFLGEAWANISAFISDAWTNITTAVSDGVNGAVEFVTGLPDRILSALGDLGSLLLNSGAALIQGFIDGIGSMLGAVGDAVGGVMDFVGGFFPSSPAKRGRFAGSGWRDLKRSGGATMDQWIGGMDPSRMEDIMRMPSASFGAGSRVPGGAAAGTRIENIYQIPEALSPFELAQFTTAMQADELRRVGAA